MLQNNLQTDLSYMLVVIWIYFQFNKVQKFVFIIKSYAPSWKSITPM